MIDMTHDQFLSWLDGALTHFEHLPAEKQKDLVLEIKARVKKIQEDQESETSDGTPDGFLC